MKVKINVTFEMVFDTVGKSTTELRFNLPEHPNLPCPEGIKKDVIGQVKMLCTAMQQSGILE